MAFNSPGASQGAQGRIAIITGDPPYTWTGGTRICFNREDLTNQDSILGPRCITGTRTQPAERTRYGASVVSGRLYLDASPAALDLFLPLITASPKDGSDQFPVTETVPSFGVLIDKVARRFEYQNCVINRAIFRGRQKSQGDDSDAELIDMIIEIIGEVETANNPEFPALDLAVTDDTRPYVFADSSLQLATIDRHMMNFVLVWDNMLQSRYANSNTPTSLVPRDRLITLRTTNPFTADELDLYRPADVHGFTGHMTWTQENMSCKWDFTTLQNPSLTPVIRGKTEIELLLDMTARGLAGGAEILVTNDSDNTS
jgi:hypothetical protein